ncbi:MAG: DUF2905 domain-containing protein [Woeseiaceae bacterium]|jgi:hypothetical protein
MGKLIIYAGLVLILVGAVVQYAPWLVSWFGRLPGDIRIQGDKGGVFIPLTSMIIISVVLTIIVNLLKR